MNLIPLPLLTDSYKTTHCYLYPEALRMSAYGEFRRSYENDKIDHRIVFMGIRYIISNYIARKFTKEEVAQSKKFFEHHNAGGVEFPFPEDLFLKFIEENDGHFPVIIRSLPEGSVIYPHVPVYQITAEKEYSRLVTYLETLLTMVWYPTTVATLSRRCHTVIKKAYDQTVDEDGFWSLPSRLHDFGFRGCTSVEQSIIGGSAHLLNFEGSDTLSAAYYTQFYLNNGNPVAYSIPATEHSIMTAYKTEKLALEQLLENFGSGVCACVMDSYDYTNALEKVLPSVAKLKVEKGGFLVLRPDSGDSVKVVLEALRAAEKLFGTTVNKKGYKIINGVGVIQGDGINIQTLEQISVAVKEAGFSAQNVAFGLGSGLLQKLNRDTMSFATKLSKLVYKNGDEREVMKMPKDDTAKRSLPGEFQVVRNPEGIPIVYPAEIKVPGTNEMEIVYDYGKVCEWDSFDDLRKRVDKQWNALPKIADPISKELLKKQEQKVSNNFFDEVVEFSDSEEELKIAESNIRGDSPPPKVNYYVDEKEDSFGMEILDDEEKEIIAGEEVFEGNEEEIENDLSKDNVLDDGMMLQEDMKRLLSFISRYTPQDMPLTHHLVPFIPEYIPCIGDIDPFIKVPRPNKSEELFGLAMVDEPSGMQSDPAKLQLRAASKVSPSDSVIRSISYEALKLNPKLIDNWAQNAQHLQLQKGTLDLELGKQEIETLMQAWPPEIEAAISELGIEFNAEIDLSLVEFSKLILTIIDIPTTSAPIIDQLHLLFVLYLEFNKSGNFKSKSRHQ